MPEDAETPAELEKKALAAIGEALNDSKTTGYVIHVSRVAGDSIVSNTFSNNFPMDDRFHVVHSLTKFLSELTP